jgi:hypothetical protein
MRYPVVASHSRHARVDPVLPPVAVAVGTPPRRGHKMPGRQASARARAHTRRRRRRLDRIWLGPPPSLSLPPRTHAATRISRRPIRPGRSAARSLPRDMAGHDGRERARAWWWWWWWWTGGSSGSGSGSRERRRGEKEQALSTSPSLSAVARAGRPLDGSQGPTHRQGPLRSGPVRLRRVVPLELARGVVDRRPRPPVHHVVPAGRPRRRQPPRARRARRQTTDTTSSPELS